LSKEFFAVARGGDVAQAKTLLDNKADVNYQDNEGRTVLSSVAPLNKPGLVAFLLSARADPDLRDERGRTPLYHAAKAADISASDFQIICDAASDLKTHDSRGVTALNVATRRGNVAAVKALIKKGADQLAGDSFGGHALKSAEVSKNDEIRFAFNLTKYEPPTTTTMAPAAPASTSFKGGDL
jgi:ankyrin repeat protein